MQENILSIFENTNIFENQIVLVVMEMMRHFDLKHYPRERGKNVYTTLGGRLLEEIRYAPPISINGCPLVRAEM